MEDSENVNTSTMKASGKRQLETVDVDASTLKYKSRKINPIRDFPQGCGRFPLRINEKENKDSDVHLVENSEFKSDAPMETVCVKPLGTSVEHRVLDVDKSLKNESVQSLSSFKSDTRKSIENLGMAEEHEQMTIVDSPKVLDKIKIVNQSQMLEPEILDLSKTKSMNLDEPMRSAYPEEKELPTVQSPIDGFSSDEPTQQNFSDQSRTSPAAEDLEGSMHTNYLSRRRISACREFLEGRERNATCVMKEESQGPVISSTNNSPVFVTQTECQKSVISSEGSLVNEKKEIVGNHAKQIGEKVQDEDAPQSKLNGINLKEFEDEALPMSEEDEHIRVKVPEKYRDECCIMTRSKKKNSTKKEVSSTRSKEKQELVVQDNNKPITQRKKENSTKKEVSSTRKDVYEDLSQPVHQNGFLQDDANQLLRKNMAAKFPADLGLSNARVTVQCLMAAPNCRFMQGKRGFGSPSSITHATTGTEGKKQELLVQDNSKAISKRKKDELETPEGKSTKKKLFPTRKAANEDSSLRMPQDDGSQLLMKMEVKSACADSGFSNERVTVQCLMAAPNCPFTQGKRGFGSPSSLACETRGSEGKKQEHMVEDNSKSISQRKKDEQENSEEKSTKKEVSPTRKASYEEGSQPILNNGNVFLQANHSPLFMKKVAVKSRSVDLGLSDERVTVQDNCRSISNRKKDESETSEGKSAEKKVSSTRKAAYESGSQLVQKDGKDFPRDGSHLLVKKVGVKSLCVDFEFSDERAIVQCLMAAPNCPFTQGKRVSRSPCSPTHATTRSQVKKQKLLLQDDTKSISERKKAEAGTSEGKFTKKKVSPTKKASYDGNQPDLKDEDFPRDDGDDGNGSVVKIYSGLHSLPDKDDDSETIISRKKVRETLRLFQAIYKKLMQEEEAKSKEEQISSSRRFTLLSVSANRVKEKQMWVNSGKPILGAVPGVEVGDEFHYRVELAIIGLHRPYQGGIDYLTGKNLATSIVASGRYGGDVDSSGILRYSGQGGKPTGAEKKAEDQKLVRGNLALKNSMDQKSPVRVIRGFKENKNTITYTYDGLYVVERYWQETGVHGTNVFMFELRRIPGQPELALKEVKNSDKGKVREGLCVADISQGKEKMPISAVNLINDEKPPPFKYITNMIYPSCYNSTLPRGCECTDGCSDSEKCLCAVKNGGEIPYNYDGAIVEEKDLVYECGPSCKCPPSCHNRVSQHGIKFQLEIFKTKSRGWGVRSLSSIPSGSFICEYTGELLEDKEAEKRTHNDEYLFDIGNNYRDPIWAGLSTGTPSDLRTSSSGESVEDVGFTIDAAECGSIGRFINHSCSPNLYTQNVLYDHEDKRMPHIMLFATENIPPLQELTYHYNYEIDQVLDSDGNIKKKDCYCGAVDCIGRMY